MNVKEEIETKKKTALGLRLFLKFAASRLRKFGRWTITRNRLYFFLMFESDVFLRNEVGREITLSGKLTTTSGGDH